MFDGLLPIGSVVLLHDSKKKVMVVGVCQLGEADKKIIYDYAGVLFPEGYLSSDKMFLFNNDQIKQIYSFGYQDEEQLAFKAKADGIIDDLRKTAE